MTKAIFTFINSQPTGFSLNGHAGFGERGQDIVCSAITTAVFTSLNLINLIITENEYELYQNEKRGIIIFHYHGDNEFIKLIINNLANVLASIAKDYPTNLKISQEYKP